MGGLIRLFEIMARNDINNRGMNVDKLESGGGGVERGRGEGDGCTHSVFYFILFVNTTL